MDLGLLKPPEMEKGRKKVRRINFSPHLHLLNRGYEEVDELHLFFSVQLLPPFIATLGRKCKNSSSGWRNPNLAEA
ncbi:hypothetical protein SESBI_03709 [Sesbania bispinosa]|nr:hypothetical protein SESBI_03709 [Sesbania bispinosa]